MPCVPGKWLWEASVRPKGTCLAWHCDGSSVVVGCEGGQVVIVDANGQLLTTMSVPPSTVRRLV